ncbi:MAG: hypothetical protein AVDCRST_MAG49-4423, partial [uncultured Thermomicrobiales bacterium]
EPGRPRAPASPADRPGPPAAPRRRGRRSMATAATFPRRRPCTRRSSDRGRDGTAAVPGAVHKRGMACL